MAVPIKWGPCQSFFFSKRFGVDIGQVRNWALKELDGCFDTLEVLLGAVLITRALVFGVYKRAADLWKIPYWHLTALTDCRQRSCQSWQAEHCT